VWINDRWVSLSEIEQQMTEREIANRAVISIGCRKCGSWMTKVKVSPASQREFSKPIVFVCPSCDHVERFDAKNDASKNSPPEGEHTCQSS
jgi:RNase P subunit RPR2